MVFSKDPYGKQIFSSPKSTFVLSIWPKSFKVKGLNKKKVINLGMISAMNTINRQSLKKVTFSSNTKKGYWCCLLSNVRENY